VQRILGRFIGGLLLALTANPVPGGGTLQGQAVAAKSLRLEMPSFVTASYGTAGASTIYAGYSFGPGAVAVGLVVNPRSGYRELVLGVVTRAVRGRQGLALALALADAPESPYLQGYLMPGLSLGACALTGTLQLYLPLRGGGTPQLDLSPLRAIVPLGGRVGLGALSTVGLAHGAPPRFRAGPVLEIGIPRGAIYAELRRNLTRARPELRVSVETGF
jgi:hypothetical protein